MVARQARATCGGPCDCRSVKWVALQRTKWVGEERAKQRSAHGGFWVLGLGFRVAKASAIAEINTEHAQSDADSPGAMCVVWLWFDDAWCVANACVMVCGECMVQWCGAMVS